ncbi:type IX secretion system membrane protein PorP/SprF [Algoriphagus sp. Y33]|uniref:PorP/SprF family type IX secretion system membrane protein n=1 Tax=Algoriphagus sp. Y33 TaxID=2772483 RepID=UPI0017814DBE|nr:type IX secretion system membrane protein PorP/SprF [Algoriphagus sp. Y33]
MKRIFLMLVFSLEISTVLSQQVPQFSQYLFNPIYINPAYTGYKNDIFVQSYYRRQWSGFEGAPETFGVAADGLVPLHNIGLGVVASADQLGLQSTQSIYLNAAYHLQTGEYSFLSFGAGIGAVNYRIKSEKYDPTVVLDPSLSGTGGNVVYPDLRIGLLYYSDLFFAGVSVDQALENILQIENVDLAVKPRRSYTLNMGGILEIGDELYLNPSLLIMDDLKAMTRVDANIFLFYQEVIGLGMGYRRSFNLFDRLDDTGYKKDIAFILMTEIRIRGKFRFGYAFEIPVSGQWKRVNSHELSLGYLITSPRSRLKSPRYF